jgi:hypothetical protein
VQSYRHPLPATTFLVFRLLTLFTICLAACPSRAQASTPGGISLPTELRVHSPGWWPTKAEASRDAYAGAAACAKCHADIAKTQQATAMAHAATLSTDSDILHQHTPLIFQLGPYREEIVTNSDKSVLTVTTPGNSATLSADLLWAFGVGHMGQTYIYKRNGGFYESQLSFYSSSQTLNITPEHSPAIPANIEDAAGRRLSPTELRRCFACHTTTSAATVLPVTDQSKKPHADVSGDPPNKDQLSQGGFDPKAAVLGITCEACHGPGATHAAAMQSGMQDQAADLIINPKHLDPVASVDFCGACHRTWEDVVATGFGGIGVYNVRFAPYRLENSKCWRKPDARLTCIACHDPHRPLEHDPAAYDSRCLQCHINQTGAKQSAGHPGAKCPVSSKNCITCHMPKIETPIQHSIFTDHWIRIVKPGKPYPN